MNNERENIALPYSERYKKNSESIKNEAIKNEIVKKNTPIISYTGKRKRSFSPRRLIFFIFPLFLAYFSIFFYAEEKLAPKITALAEAQGKNHLLETVNRSINELAKEGLVTYNGMVRTIRDQSGEVIYLEVDTAMLNTAKTVLIEKINTSLKENDTIRLKIPLGSLSSWNLLSGMGFPVRVKLFPIGMTEGEIFTVLEDCGINQTRHLIQIRLKTTLLLVLPGENATAEWEFTIPLGERVLVGDVPEIYLDTLGVG